MKKRNIMLIIITLIVIVIVLVVVGIKCSSADAEFELEQSITNQISELTCTVESEDEALQIAADYNIELTSFSDGVAVFQTDKPYNEICEYGENHNLKKLYINMNNKKLLPEED